MSGLGWYVSGLPSVKAALRVRVFTISRLVSHSHSRFSSSATEPANLGRPLLYHGLKIDGIDLNYEMHGDNLADADESGSVCDGFRLRQRRIGRSYFKCEQRRRCSNGISKRGRPRQEQKLTNKDNLCAFVNMRISSNTEIGPLNWEMRDHVVQYQALKDRLQNRVFGVAASNNKWFRSYVRYAVFLWSSFTKSQTKVLAAQVVGPDGEKPYHIIVTADSFQGNDWDVIVVDFVSVASYLEGADDKQDEQDAEDAVEEEAASARTLSPEYSRVFNKITDYLKHAHRLCISSARPKRGLITSMPRNTGRISRPKRVFLKFKPDESRTTTLNICTVSRLI